MVRKKEALLVLLIYFLFLVANVVYLYSFALSQDHDPIRMNFGKHFYFALNLDNDYAYVPQIRLMESGAFHATLDNRAFISYLYYYLKRIFGFSYEALPIVSFVVNNIAILLSYHYFVKIGLQLGLNMSYRWLFFLNPALIYFSQLINKEPFSLLSVLALTYYLGQRQYFKLATASLVSILVRMQLGAVGLFSFLLHGRRRYLLNLFLFYLLTSLAGVFVQAHSKTLHDYMRQAKPGGMTALIQGLNQKYFIGSLLLNPIKGVQYAYDQFRCLWQLITPEGRINLYLLRDLPISLAFLYYSCSLLRAFSHLRTYRNTVCGPLLTVIIVFIMILLMNPVVQARFLFPISYSLLLLAIYVSHAMKKPKTESV